jgi:predicted nuclease of predicted toxin-antitoxin system
VKFKTDENLPVEAADLLRQAGHDALSVVEQHLGGSDDSRIATICQRESRVLVTIDTDFANIQNYPPGDFSGLIVLRLKRQDKKHVLDVLARLTKVFLDEPLVGYLWIVEDERIRIRKGRSALDIESRF